MRYDLTGIEHPCAPRWPQGIGTIMTRLPDGSAAGVPVLPGVNVMCYGVVGTGKTRFYTLPAAELILRADPRRKGGFFEIKRTFLDHFLQPDDKVITHDSAAARPQNLFRPNLIREIRQSDDPSAEMRQIADFLFSDLLNGADQNLGWIQAARDTFVGVLRVIVDLFPQENTTNQSPAFENFSTGPAATESSCCNQLSGTIYRRLSFSSRKTTRTSFLAVRASARLCWNLLTSWNLRS